ncbi:3-ketoacyl-CoA reductase, putative [Eimeria tenella]|uniref:3-ketoacyl-CoA reductase, putative n=1 Tax=Eimeria tenella TaxID=5802 RepID=U6L080_EIMTE|nr:3-ketoacyl-CoA reductase, putative [Eimeria tenella]CDJ43606.1 3-ketoacyl-CoA reductase, putative [Eimeria tenella]|eukprot:XP_013234355.1 3-ketoacyl-CoA reductase, putative [Eimeria tenella]
MWSAPHCACCQQLLQRLAACPFMSCVLLLLAAFAALRLIVAFVTLCCYTGKRLQQLLLPRGAPGGGPGEWALITGASDGIGKALASQLAKAGASQLLLVARSEEKLKDVATELELTASGPLKVCRLVVDFAAESSEEIFKKVSEAIKDKNISLLVNNAGISYPHAMYYDEVPLSLIEELIDVNVRSALVVTRAVLPGMKARKKGLVVCVGSSSSELPSDPLYSAYAASKGAVEAFCRSLQLLGPGERGCRL